MTEAGSLEPEETVFDRNISDTDCNNMKIFRMSILLLRDVSLIYKIGASWPI